MIKTAVNQCHRLEEKVRMLLLSDWDPIGVKDMPSASSEYNAYVQEICGMLRDGGDRHVIFEYLWRLETEHMGLAGNRNSTSLFAAQLLTLEED